jgi:hypothetical protein
MVIARLRGWKNARDRSGGFVAVTPTAFRHFVRLPVLYAFPNTV